MVRRTEVIQIRLTPQEKAKIREMAKESGHSDSEFCRWRILRNTRIRKGDERPELTYESDPEQPEEVAIPPEELERQRAEANRVDERLNKEAQAAWAAFTAGKDVPGVQKPAEPQRQAEPKAVQLPNGMIF